MGVNVPNERPVSTFKHQSCSVLEKSHIGAKSDFEIWVFKGLFFGPEKKPLGRLAGGYK